MDRSQTESMAMGDGNAWETPARVRLVSLFWDFLKIGATAFGGFMALISVVQALIVERRKLLRHEDMLDAVSLATLLPGPVAVNVVAYVGFRLRGAVGALVCAVAVLLPAFTLIVALSYAYFRWGQVPAVSKLFMGFIPAMAAIILSAAWAMGQKAARGKREIAIAAVAGILLLSVGGFVITVGIMVGAGIAGWLMFRNKSSGNGGSPPPAKSDDVAGPPRRSGLLSVAAPLAAIPLFSLEFGLLAKLFVVFAGMSVMLFGGGYVFIPLISEIVVKTHGWVTQQEFVDAIAMGQITPGPILISAAFIGFKVAGLAGAVVATIGIYLPPALLMIGGSSILDRIKQSKVVSAVLRGVRPAVVGMIFAAALVIAQTAQYAWPSALIFAAAAIALFRFKVNVIWVIPAAGLAGLVLY